MAEIYAPQREKRLVEPFCGGLSVALALQPEQALLNDVCAPLIHFYRWLQRGLEIAPLENDRETYNAARDEFNVLLLAGKGHTKRAAELFYILNRTGFNGLCRFNSAGKFNVPFGRHKTLPTRRDFRDYAPILANWKFQNGPFQRLKLAPDDFVYADPPYDVPFTRYSKEKFGWADQIRLANWLAKYPGPVVASNQATERVLELYEALEFKVEIVLAPRRIACNGNREPAREMLATRGL